MCDQNINKPCPFCGSTDLDVCSIIMVDAYRVRCGNCIAEGPAADTPRDAVEKWNARTKGDIQ